MNRTTKAYLLLVAGVLIWAGIILYNSLSGGARSLSHLVTVYWPGLLVGAGLILGFIWLSGKQK